MSNEMRRAGIACLMCVWVIGCGTDPPGQAPFNNQAGQTTGEELELTVVGATATPNSGQAPLEVTFSAGAVDGVEPYRASWVFGDGSDPAEGLTVQHRFVRAGEFVARVTLTDDAGASATAEVPVRITEGAAPVITRARATPSQGIAPLNVSFSATVTGAGAQPQYAWDFGDGSTSDLATPSHTFTSGGTFTVGVVVTNGETGVASERATVEVEVASDAIPAAAASATPASGIAPLTVSFRGTVVGGNGPFNYTWDYGDGSAGSTGQNPSKVFDTPGVYTVLFTVTDADGDEDTASVDVSVQDNTVPQVALTATPSTGYAPLTAQFDPGVSGGDLPLTYQWSFGDGDTSTQANPSHVYTTPGTYTVTLEVTDANGDQATDTSDVVVTTNETPQATASATPDAGLAPLTVQFDAQASGGNGALTYQWSFGDGGSASIASPSHIYQTAGQYTATVVVTDADGDSTSGQVIVDVGSDLVPSANASASPVSGFSPLTVDFFGNASGGNGALSYTWNFGDGSATSTDQNPTHTYTLAGTYTATLLVEDTDGDSSSDTVRIEVVDNQIPQVTGSATPDSGIAPFNVSFQASVSGGDSPFTYVWDFGDNEPASPLQNTNHSYTNGGTFVATVTVTDANGDTDTDAVTITVADDQTPTVTATADVDTGTAPLTVQLDAAGAGGNGALTYQWFFGDGSVPASGASVQHTYQNAGIYTASVVVTDADGDTAQDDVAINALTDAPDLRAKTLGVSINDDDVTYTLEVENVGSEDSSGSFVVRFYDDLAAAPDDQTSASMSQSVSMTVPAGGTTTVTATSLNRPVGVYSAWAYVDPLRANPDRDRSNNIIGPQGYSVDVLVINEVMVATTGSDEGVFVELFGRPGLDLSGYVLEEVNGSNGAVDAFTIPNGTVIPADGFIVIGDATTPNVDVVTPWADLQNGPDSVVIKDTQGAVQDAVGYGAFGPGDTFEGEGTTAGEAGDDYSLGRDAASLDTGDNAADFYSWSSPTPGEPNAQPGTGETCGSGIALSDGRDGRFLVEGTLTGKANDFTSLDDSADSTCSLVSNAATLGGSDQAFSFEVPAGRTGSVELTLFDSAARDLDSVLVRAPCAASLTTNVVGCSVFTGASLSETFTGLTPGTYHVILFEDADTYSGTSDADFSYVVELTTQ